MDKLNGKILLLICFSIFESFFNFEGLNDKVALDIEKSMQAELAAINNHPDVRPFYDSWKSTDNRLTDNTLSLNALNKSAAQQKRRANGYDQTVTKNENEIKKEKKDYLLAYQKKRDAIVRKWESVRALSNQKDRVWIRAILSIFLPGLTIICGAYILTREKTVYTFVAYQASAFCQIGCFLMMFQNLQQLTQMHYYSFFAAGGFAGAIFVGSRWANMKKGQVGNTATMTVTSTHTVTLNDLPRDYEKCIEVMAQLRADNMPTPPVRDVAHEVLRLRSHSRFAQQVKDKYDEIVNSKERKVA